MRERTFHFGPGGQLLGTICRPTRGRPGPAGLGLILLNAGIVHRIGPHRFNVKLARRAASMGIPSLRFDLSGRGDSGPGKPGRNYKELAVEDVREAVAVLSRDEGPERFMLFGICSGAIDGYLAALSEPRIASLVMFDPYVFPTMRAIARECLSKIRKYGIGGGFSRLMELRHVRHSPEADADDGGSELPPIDQYAADLRTLAERGVNVHLIYSGSSCDNREYESQRRKLLGGRGLDALIRTELMQDVDHVITSLRAQERVLSRFDDWVAAVPAGS